MIVFRSGTFEALTRERTLYKNGFKYAYDKSTAILSVAGIIQIGGYAQVSTPTIYRSTLNGAIDNVQLWTRKLSLTELSTAVNNPSSFLLSTSLLVYYKFDATSGIFITDASGNARSLVIRGTSTLPVYELDYTLCESRCSGTSIDDGEQK
jgi:hypothetical protein